jgi:hypothetical protein
MDIMLSKEEIEREKHMFAPHESSYVLEVEGFKITEYKEKTSQAELDEAPMTC